MKIIGRKKIAYHNLCRQSGAGRSNFERIMSHPSCQRYFRMQIVRVYISRNTKMWYAQKNVAEWQFVYIFVRAKYQLTSRSNDLSDDWLPTFHYNHYILHFSIYFLTVHSSCPCGTDLNSEVTTKSRCRWWIKYDNNINKGQGHCKKEF